MFNGNGPAYAAGAAIPTRLGIFSILGTGSKPDRWESGRNGAGWRPAVADAGWRRWA